MNFEHKIKIVREHEKIYKENLEASVQCALGKANDYQMDIPT